MNTIGVGQLVIKSTVTFKSGEFILPYINGPNEGVLILASIYLMSSQLDDHTTFWHVQETLPFIGGRFERRDVALAL